MISIENVSKTYVLNDKPLHRIRSWMKAGNIRPDAVHHAVNDLSLKIGVGETVGILGANGAGKSTLLQMITGTLTPTAGRIEIDGRIAALLELGAGFNPDWTGRKNAEFQCVMQGSPSSEIAAKVAEIEAFADIGLYFDQPARTYSSGMFVRVAFACSVATNPDILIVDEALAVGDVKFQNKCFRRFEEMQARGCTILLVTHSPDLIARFCTRAIVMHQGKLLMDGSPSEAVLFFARLIHGTVDDAEALHLASGNAEVNTGIQAHTANSNVVHIGTIEDRIYYNDCEESVANKSTRIRDAVLKFDDGVEVQNAIPHGSRLSLTVSYDVLDVITQCEIGMIIRNKQNQVISGSSNRIFYKSLKFDNVPHTFKATWSFSVDLLPETYFIDLGISDVSQDERLVLHWRQAAIRLDIVPNANKSFNLFGIVGLQTSLDIDQT